MHPVCVEPKRGDYSRSAKPTLIFALICSPHIHHVTGLCDVRLARLLGALG
jgi:hypothetical protein